MRGCHKQNEIAELLFLEVGNMREVRAEVGGKVMRQVEKDG